MRCEQCFVRIGANDRFCSKCGSEQPDRPVSKRLAVTEYVKEVGIEGRQAASEGIKVLAQGAKTPTGKSIAACAALGAVVGSVVPFVGTAFGASIGAGIGLIRKL